MMEIWISYIRFGNPEINAEKIITVECAAYKAVTKGKPASLNFSRFLFVAA